MYKVFIDGLHGTTGLRIQERFATRSDVELIIPDESLRKDVSERKRLINESDFTVLCLPDDAAREAVSLVEKDHVRIIDASTAHRTTPGWAYGFPELSPEHYQAVKHSNRVAVPGCHASGFLAIVYPLVKCGVIDSDYQFVCYSMSGYSGAGKSAIAQYEAGGDEALNSPRQYALTQTHKHLREMQFVGGVFTTPIFSPFICNFYSGMEVTVPLFGMLMRKYRSVEALYEFFADYYKDQPFVRVERAPEGMIPSNMLSGKDYMTIYIGGNDQRILPVAVYDNLGKGASGAAVECMNIMMGIDHKTGLVL